VQPTALKQRLPAGTRNDGVCPNWAIDWDTDGAGPEQRDTFRHREEELPPIRGGKRRISKNKRKKTAVTTKLGQNRGVVGDVRRDHGRITILAAEEKNRTEEKREI